MLRKALEHYARRGGPTSLEGLIDTAVELPDGVSGSPTPTSIAADLAQITDGGHGQRSAVRRHRRAGGPGSAADPAGGQAGRVSVISLVGLRRTSQRQSFVNQLQMALFAWIKKHPAGDRPLGGLFVMDEAQTFAPSGAMTACTQSTLALASQARSTGSVWCSPPRPRRGCTTRFRVTPRPSSSAC